MKTLHDLFITTNEDNVKTDDMYSFNKMYMSTPFECIKNTSMIAAG